MGSSRASQQTSNTTRTVLPANQQQNVDLLMQGARDLYNSGGPQFFPGQTYANPTENQLTSRQQAANYATGVGQEFVNNYQAG
jgi:hypothetical protein